MLTERLFIKASKLCRVFIGIVFLIAGLSKMIEPYSFAAQVSVLTRSLLGDGLSTIIPSFLVFILPPVEVILGVALIVDLRPEITGRLAVGFLVMFVGITFWLWYYYSRPLDFHPSAFILQPLEDCGCFGSLMRRSPSEAMVEDIILLSIASLGLIKIQRQVLKSRFEWKVYLVLGVGLGIISINGICLVCFG